MRVPCAAHSILHLCRDGLCFVMPDELKSIIRALAENHPSDFETSIRSLAAARPASDRDRDRTDVCQPLLPMCECPSDRLLNKRS